MDTMKKTTIRPMYVRSAPIGGVVESDGGSVTIYAVRFDDAQFFFRYDSRGVTPPTCRKIEMPEPFEGERRTYRPLEDCAVAKVREMAKAAILRHVG